MSIDSIYTLTKRFAVNTSSGTVHKTDSLNVTVTFTPDTTGSFTDTLYIHNNSATTLVRIPLSGLSPMPVFTAGVPSISFSSTAKGDSSVYSLKLYNYTINILTVNTESNNLSSFHSNVSLPVSATPNDSITVPVIFKPNSFSSFTDTLSITSTGGNLKIPLSGSSPYPAIVLNSNPISFGIVVVHTPSLKTIAIKDTSISALSIDSIYTLTKRFAVNTTSGTVNKTDSLNVTVTFTPDTTGSFTDTLYIHNNSNISLVRIPLSGSSPMPVVLTDLSLVDFGTLQTTNSATQTIKITNNTVNSLVIDTAYFKTKYFTITGVKFPTTILNTDTLSATLNFNPDTTRSYKDTLYIVNNSSVPLFKIPIDGQKKNVTGIMLEKSGIPDHFDISQNYPNPFNPTTLIKYQLPKSMLPPKNWTII